MDADARRLTLAEGEAAFDVTHDPSRPLLLRTGDREVKVVGTEFNLRRREGRVVLTVRRGLVEVRPAEAPSAPPARVGAGQQLAHFETSGRATLGAVDPEEAFAWTAGRLVYRDAPLSEVAADLGRQFARPVRLADAQTAQIRFTGVLAVDDQTAVFRRLEGFVPVSAVASEDGGVVLRRR
jgi:transmembrane sensor